MSSLCSHDPTLHIKRHQPARYQPARLLRHLCWLLAQLQRCNQTCAASMSERMSVKAAGKPSPALHLPIMHLSTSRLRWSCSRRPESAKAPTDTSAPVNVLRACGLLVVLRVFYLLAALTGKTEKKRWDSSFWSSRCHGKLKLNLDTVAFLRRAFMKAQLSLSLVFAKKHLWAFMSHLQVHFAFFKRSGKKNPTKSLSESEKMVFVYYIWFCIRLHRQYNRAKKQ